MGVGFKWLYFIAFLSTGDMSITRCCAMFMCY